MMVLNEYFSSLAAGAIARFRGTRNPIRRAVTRSFWHGTRHSAAAASPARAGITDSYPAMYAVAAHEITASASAAPDHAAALWGAA